ncbi:MAG: DNA-binding transcriptional regulator [Daejeonella sp.]|nr:DNA-binding transcriptional regulator [Daejeonella sp.]
MCYPDIPRLSRLTAILTLLQTKQLITAVEIGKKFSVSVRTIYRDLKALEQAGVPICVSEGKGYFLTEGYRIPPVMFTETEANALITAEKLILNNKDASFVKGYSEAITKIKAVLKHSTKNKADLLSQRIIFRQNEDHATTSNNLSSIQIALTNNILIKLDYKALHTGKVSSRIIEPFAMYSTQGNWILIAFCRLRNEYRAFRLDGIAKMILMDEKFSPHQLTLQEYFEICRQKSTPDILLSIPCTKFGVNKNHSSMETHQIAPFYLIGITVRTTNENDTAAQDIHALWSQFLNNQTLDKIPNKLDSSIYSVYTDYEKDHTKPYTTLLGCKVTSLENIPEGMTGKRIDGGTYVKFSAKGNLNEGIVYNEWISIWNSDINRVYTTDFEIYGEKSTNPKDAEVDIFVAVEA